jgi:hypothetical protein
MDFIYCTQKLYLVVVVMWVYMYIQYIYIYDISNTHTAVRTAIGGGV